MCSGVLHRDLRWAGLSPLPGVQPHAEHKEMQMGCCLNVCQSLGWRHDEEEPTPTNQQDAEWQLQQAQQAVAGC